ncbi:hypothetical protein KCP74_17340 [Salmonella enterica subsp. enterica]|nr:hypothetical protein KCP74_17340 [Salmonella enterica subsp. enterica]
MKALHPVFVVAFCAPYTTHRQRLQAAAGNNNSSISDYSLTKNRQRIAGDRNVGCWRSLFSSRFNFTFSTGGETRTLARTGRKSSQPIAKPTANSTTEATWG